MRTELAEGIRDTVQGQEAEALVRKCVHCGFCLATCPTYNLLGDELDSPRGRIYLMKQMLEGGTVTARTQLHLDRCLTCRACETTCPSGVQYGRLVDIGRAMVDERVQRPAFERLRRAVLRRGLLSPTLFGLALGMGRAVRGLLPAALARKVPVAAPAGERPAARRARRMIVLEGCVQPAIAPSINAAAARVLDAAGISLVTAPQAGCCGAVSHHLDAHEAALAAVRANIDAWWPLIEAGAEAVVITASGCGTMVRDYGHLLARDERYAAKAARISELSKDVSEVVAAERATLAGRLAAKGKGRRIAFHSPCSLQHGLAIRGVVETILRDAGFELTAVPDAHACCGSAGTYSILQPELSARLLASKVTALESGGPELIVTANVGCLSHIGSGSQRPVRHWIELIDDQLRT